METETDIETQTDRQTERSQSEAEEQEEERHVDRWGERESGEKETERIEKGLRVHKANTYDGPVENGQRGDPQTSGLMQTALQVLDGQVGRVDKEEGEAKDEARANRPLHCRLHELLLLPIVEVAFAGPRTLRLVHSTAILTHLKKAVRDQLWGCLATWIDSYANMPCMPPMFVRVQYYTSVICRGTVFLSTS